MKNIMKTERNIMNSLRKIKRGKLESQENNNIKREVRTTKILMKITNNSFKTLSKIKS